MKPIDLAGFDRKFADNDDPWATFSNRDEARKRRAILRGIGTGPVGRVLELAAGNGSNSVALACRALRLDATEGTKSGTDLVRRAVGKDARVRVRQVVLPAPFPAPVYDAAVVAEVLYYLSPADMAQVARDVAAHLRPGGRLVLAQHRVDIPISSSTRTASMSASSQPAARRGAAVIACARGAGAWTPMYAVDRSPPTRPLRVAMLAPIAWRTPPRHYGPWELATSLLTEALVARGVDVTLFATQDSITNATLAGVVPRPYNEDSSVDAKVWEMRHVARVMERADAFDIIHNQADFVPLAFSRFLQTPIVTTLHGMPSERILPMLAEYQHDVHYVAISETDRSPHVRYAATIPHGIDVDAFPLNTTPAKELLFFGRIHPDKGTAVAIQVARGAGLPLHIAGIVQDERYFEEEVRPWIDGSSVRYSGALGGVERLDALGSATALLHLIDFEEPFGLSVVEALACGTPVVAFGRGSMPNLIRNGVTGFVIDTPEQAVAAVAAIGSVDRRACRADVARRFSVYRMARDYYELYRQIAAKSSHLRSRNVSNQMAR